MVVRKLLVVAGVGLALYFLSVDPTSAAAAARSIGGVLEDGATGFITFLKGVFE